MSKYNLVYGNDGDVYVVDVKCGKCTPKVKSPAYIDRRLNQKREDRRPRSQEVFSL